MEARSFRPRLDVRQGVSLLPAVVMGIFAVGMLIWKKGGAETALLLGGMTVIWLAYGLWQILGQRYSFDDGGVTVYAGSRRTRIPYPGLKTVMLGDVTMPGSKMARGTLLLQPVTGKGGSILYPRVGDAEVMIALLRERAPEAVFLTTKAEVEAYRASARQKKA